MSQNGTDPAIVAELRAAQRRAHEAAAEHQAQGTGKWIRAAEPSQSERQQRNQPQNRSHDPANPS